MPTIVLTTQPASATVADCSNVTFMVAAKGNGPLTYQWWFNDQPVPGATNTTYEIGFVNPTNAGAYTVAISDSCLAVASAHAFLTVNPSVLITSQPASATLGPCADASNCPTFSVGATGTEPLRYQWFVNGAIIMGATASSYNPCLVTLADNGNQYTVKVTSTCSSVTSDVATLTVRQADTTAPMVICPDLTVQCDAYVPPPNAAAVTATDNQDPAPVVMHVSDVISGTCPKTVVRTYKATDACGNMSLCTQTIIVHDTIAPVFLCALPQPNLVSNPSLFRVYSRPAAGRITSPLAISMTI